MCVLCIEQQLRVWQEKVKDTGEPLTKEETIKLLEISRLLNQGTDNGDVWEEAIMDSFDIDVIEDCLNE